MREHIHALSAVPRGKKQWQIMGVWVGPRADLNAFEKRKFLSLPEVQHDSSVVHPVVQSGCLPSCPGWV
jgi:hypothetical protein